MKHYYRIGDAIMQVLMLCAVIYAFISNIDGSLAVIALCGVWYLISVGVHVIIGSHSYKAVYRSYAYITAVVVGLLGIGRFFPLLLFLVGYGLIYAAPVLAVCYTCNCFAEILYLRKRPMSYLK